MTIKEIEERSGMSRANIRYYENEGLLTPARNANGYRDYTEEDLSTLLKIKLLRSVEASLEEIKELQEGSSELVDFLDSHLQNLTTQQQQLEHAKEICQMIQQEGSKYGTLNARKYLDYMERSFKESNVIFNEAIREADVIPKENIPWRRFFARNLDMVLYGLLWDMFLVGVCNVNILQESTALTIVSTIMILVLMILAEPVLLSVFGTTFGKWVLGIRITDFDGNKPGYEEALQRTAKVILFGLGLSIPVYDIVRLVKSYRSCEAGEDMEWEYHTNISHRDRGWVDMVLYVTACGCALLVQAGALALARVPENRGDITAEEFCENMNQLAQFFNILQDRELLEDGTWTEEEAEGTVIGYTMENVESPRFTFTEEGGKLKKVSFSESFFLPANNQNQRSAFGMIRFYADEMSLAVLSFVPAMETYPLFSQKVYDITEHIAKQSYEDFSFELYGVKITYDIEYENFENMKREGFLMKLDDSVDAQCSFNFTMELQE